MPLYHYPYPGDVLQCDFRGFIAPEMVKVRPVVIISSHASHRRRLCTIVPLSTTQAMHSACSHKLSENPCPEFSSANDIWAKCDMLYTVSFDRLDRFHRKTRRDGRSYYVGRLEIADLTAIVGAVKSHLGL
jgi:uncharacterized protein YifN (PemK superfamily)